MNEYSERMMITIQEIIKDRGISRDEIVSHLSARLDKPVTLNQFNNWFRQSRPETNPDIDQLTELLVTINDFTPLNIVLNPHGLSISNATDRRFRDLGISVQNAANIISTQKERQL